MTAINGLGHQILNVLQRQLIPWADSGAPFAFLNTPPKTLGFNSVKELPGPQLPLKRGFGQKVRMQFWLEEHLNSMTVPYMGCVVEGEADIVTATTTAICKQLNIPGKKWIINLKERSFFIVPPNIPLSGGNGDRIHWEGKHPENAYSKIFWMQFHTTGVHCHFCTTEKEKHWTHPYYFIYNQELLPLAEMLIKEGVTQAPLQIPLLYLRLSTLLHLMARSLLSDEHGKDYPQSTHVPFSVALSTEELIRSAIRYIEEHLDDRTLTVKRIAEHVQLSQQHFARLFQQIMHTSVKSFVTERRMETACQLLTESDFHIQRIALHTGYASSAAFIKAFSRHKNMTPSQFRNSKSLNIHFEQRMSVLDA